MKRKKWFSAFGEADEQFIEEADPAKARKVNRFPWKRFSVIAACLLLMLTALNVYLFKPITVKEPNLTAYEDSAYFTVIRKLSALTHESAVNSLRHKNNFERLWNTGFGFGCTAEDMTGDAPNDNDTADGVGGAEKYEEITDNQTAGIVEGDRIKRTDDYIYYLSEGCTLRVYSVAKDETAHVASFAFSSVGEIGGNIRAQDRWEIYLSEDGETVTAIGVFYSSAYQSTMTAVLALDVSDKTSIAVRNKTFLSGDYLSSRTLSDGTLLLITRFYAHTGNYDEEKSFVPYSVKNGVASCIDPAQIVAPDKITGAYYTVLTRFDGESFAEKDAMAFLSYAEDVYVSSEHIFTMRSYTDAEKRAGYEYRTDKTEIIPVRYRDTALTALGSIVESGRVKDRYSLDEYEGMLRFVTTTGGSVIRDHSYEGNADDSSVSFGVLPSNANLYLYRLEDLNKLSEVIAFAPEGETVESVRFDGTAAYVCTALVVTLKDPVFFFDLSDPYHITYKDTGVIEGYSSSLVSLGNGFLLGIGYGEEWDSLKCEIYRESENGVVSVDAFTMGNVTFSESYKSYYIDRENGLIGIGIEQYRNDRYEYSDGYIVLHFDGYSIEKVAYLAVDGNEEMKRGCYIDGWFYAFGGNRFEVKKIFD